MTDMKPHLATFKTIIRRGQDGYFVASVASLPGCHTQAKTYEELRRRIREAILLCLEVSKNNQRYSRTPEPTFLGIEEIAVTA